jgi:type IV secretory pathway VirB3-like protein
VILAMLLLVAGSYAFLVWMGSAKDAFPDLRASVALPLLLLLGLGSLLLLLALLVAVLSAYGLTDKRHAFGLPDGSMQAVIALALILIFVIASLYLYSSLPSTISAASKEAAQNQRELAQQLLTTVGTLAVAVAGFYFGTRSVSVAAAAVAPEATVVPTLRLVWPASPITVEPGNTFEPIIVETDPPDRRIKTTVMGDEAASLQEVAHGTFRYTRGAPSETKVTLSFSLMDDSQKHDLEVQPP